MNEREIVKHMTQLEAERFSANDYRGLEKAPAFSISRGNAPLVISAPHAVTQLRDGKMKPSDDFTGALAIVVSEIVGCSSMVACRYDGSDYNWDPFEACPYKQALADFIRDNGIVAVIDVHGVPSASPHAIEIGSADGVSVRTMPGVDALAAESLRCDLAPFLERHSKDIALNGVYGARGPNTVTSAMARECGVASLQLEIATPFRVPSDIGNRTPAGEAVPFTNEQLPSEISSRHNPDPACVAATVRSVARLGELLLDKSI